MEIHQHSHTPRKKWSHYFWEFFMLFLAVTLGFFVENKREHYIEHKREKEYMKQLVQDLKNDTAFFAHAIRANLLNQERMDQLMALLKEYQPNNSTDEIYFLARTIPSMGISPQFSNRSFEQMKNSGTLRLIPNHILDSITSYYESLRDLQVRADHRMERLNNLFIVGEELFEGWAFNAIADSGFVRISPAPPLLKSDKYSISRYITRLGYYKVTDKVIIDRISNYHLPAAVKLINFLQRKYQLE